MIGNGLKVSTRKKYFSRLYTIYREWKSTAGDNPFEFVKPLLTFDLRFDNKEANLNLERIGRLIKRPKDTCLTEYTNLFLYLLYNPMVTLKDVITMRFDDYDVNCAQIDEIIDEQKEIHQHHAYVFGSWSNLKTEPRILSVVEAGFNTITESAGMKFSAPFSRNSILAIWITAALKAGVSIADVRAIISDIPSEYSSLCIVPIVHRSDEQKRVIIRKVADFINNQPRQWFVMKMRTGQNPETVKEKIKMTTEGILDKIQFYYPTHRVTRRSIKGRSVKIDVPLIPGVLFFKISRSLVPMLMTRIAEVAWCFKYANSAESQYCTISHNEMKMFQRCIGAFSPDVEMELEVRDIPLEKGTIVKINGGGRMIGQEAVIQSVKSVNGIRTYTLSLTNYLLAKWTVKDVEEIYIDPINKND